MKLNGAIDTGIHQQTSAKCTGATELQFETHHTGAMMMNHRNGNFFFTISFPKMSGWLVVVLRFPSVCITLVAALTSLQPKKENFETAKSNYNNQL